ncbi:hypothetical protein OGZ01_26335 [Vibrio harveyi]|nr:hypothetical protein [Vibrio harveyi]
MEFFVGAIIIYILYKLITGNSKSKTSNSYESSQNNTVSKPSAQKSDAYSTQAISVSSYNDSDEEFATFTIRTSFGRETEKSPNKQKGRWVGESEQLTINGRRLHKGLFTVVV